MVGVEDGGMRQQEFFSYPTKELFRAGGRIREPRWHRREAAATNERSVLQGKTSRKGELWSIKVW
jgi:hypothetical protein